MATQVEVATTDGTVQNSTLSGTSMATPMVAGGIAAVLDANPGLRGDADAIRERVRDGARPIPNAATAEVGQGMFAADHAVAGTTPARDQSEAMADDASRRDDVYQALSDASGGWLPLAAVASRGQASS
jgi:subtilisin family serine protease